jgi:hypothetical protein
MVMVELPKNANTGAGTSVANIKHLVPNGADASLNHFVTFAAYPWLAGQNMRNAARGAT